MARVDLLRSVTVARVDLLRSVSVARVDLLRGVSVARVDLLQSVSVVLCIHLPVGSAWPVWTYFGASAWPVAYFLQCGLRGPCELTWERERGPCGLTSARQRGPLHTSSGGVYVAREDLLRRMRQTFTSPKGVFIIYQREGGDGGSEQVKN